MTQTTTQKQCFYIVSGNCWAKWKICVDGRRGPFASVCALFSLLFDLKFIHFGNIFGIDLRIEVVFNSLFRYFVLPRKMMLTIANPVTNWASARERERETSCSFSHHKIYFITAKYFVRYVCDCEAVLFTSPTVQHRCYWFGRCVAVCPNVFERIY